MRRSSQNPTPSLRCLRVKITDEASRKAFTSAGPHYIKLALEWALRMHRPEVFNGFAIFGAHQLPSKDLNIDTLSVNGSAPSTYRHGHEGQRNTSGQYSDSSVEQRRYHQEYYPSRQMA